MRIKFIESPTNPSIFDNIPVIFEGKKVGTSKVDHHGVSLIIEDDSVAGLVKQLMRNKLFEIKVGK